MSPEDLLSRIEAYLLTGAESAPAFGMRALGDPRFVYQLRKGREPRRKTIAKALAALTAPKKARAA